MSAKPGAEVRRAGDGDAREIGRLLDDFNREFGDATPGAEALGERVGELRHGGAGRGRPDGPSMLYYEREL